MKLQVGQQVGPYRILSLLGAGGMGEVYLAHDPSLDRQVALKFLPESMEKDEKARQLLLREARSAAALDHPYICKIYEIGEAEARPYIAMERVEGRTLEERISQGPLPLTEALELDPGFAGAHAGLAHAYARGADQQGLSPEWLNRAEQEARQALAIDPDLPEAHFALGYTYMRMRRLTQALPAAEKTVALGPSNLNALVILGYVLSLEMGRHVRRSLCA